MIPLIVLLLASAVRAQVASTRPIALEEAYALALARSEVLVQDAEAVKQALARVDELKGAIAPHLAISGSENFQQNPHSGVTSLDKTSYPLAQLTLTQPLFSGFREFMAFKQGKKQAQSLALTQRRAESLLYQDVAQAFFSLQQVQNELAIRGESIRATQERIDQLEEWVRIGRSRDSEALAARSQLAQAEAQVELARGAASAAQEVLRFLTGVEAEFSPLPAAAPAVEPIEPFVVRARARDDVEARRRDVDASRLFISVQSRQRWPTIGLTADYYLKRNGFSSNTHYDASIGASLPLFSGGQITAQVKEAKAASRAAEQALSLAERAAEQQVRSAHSQFRWSVAAAEALRKAADLAAANLKAQEKDYRLSLVNNLQVLDSLNALQAARLQLNSARQQALLARAQLEVAAGGPRR